MTILFVSVLKSENRWTSWPFLRIWYLFAGVRGSKEPHLSRSASQSKKRVRILLFYYCTGHFFLFFFPCLKWKWVKCLIPLSTRCLPAGVWVFKESRVSLPVSGNKKRVVILWCIIVSVKSWCLKINIRESLWPPSHTWYLLPGVLAPPDSHLSSSLSVNKKEAAISWPLVALVHLRH